MKSDIESPFLMVQIYGFWWRNLFDDVNPHFILALHFFVPEHDGLLEVQEWLDGASSPLPQEKFDMLWKALKQRQWDAQKTQNASFCLLIHLAKPDLAVNKQSQLNVTITSNEWGGNLQTKVWHYLPFQLGGFCTWRHQFWGAKKGQGDMIQVALVIRS